MAIPFKVNLRSLFVRRISTFTTVVCLALVVAVFSAMMALAIGLEQTFKTTGDPLNVMVMRDGSTSETNSIVGLDQYQILRALSGIAARSDGSPDASGSVVIIINQNKRGTKDGANIILRGMPPEAIAGYREIHVVEGRAFQAGQSEVIVAKSIAAKFEGCGLGEVLPLKKRSFKVVGLFDAGGTAHGSEIWGDVTEIRDVFGRTGFSTVTLRAQDASAVPALKAAIKADQRLKLEAKTEPEYFGAQTQQASGIKAVGNFLAIILAIGAGFGAANTMYAAVSARGREIGTLRALGFSRGSILLAYVMEAMVLGVMGGVVGIAFTWIFLNGLTTGTVNWTTFSEVSFAFRVTPFLVAIAIAFASVIGAVGGFLPARFAARAPITQALREL